MPTFTLTGYRWTGTFYGNPTNSSVEITLTDDDNQMNWFGDDNSIQTVTTSDGRHTTQLVDGGSLLEVRMLIDGQVVIENVAFFLVQPPYDWYFFTLPGSQFGVGDTLLGNTGNGWTDAGVGWNYDEVTCFAEGTQITTPNGPKRIERLLPGDLVVTRDTGPQPLRWVGRKTVPAAGKLAPVVFDRGAIGNNRRLVVSPQHRILLNDWRSQLFYGENEVLVRAIDMVDGDTIRQVHGGMVTYLHLLFDNHEIIRANGAQCESLYLGDVALGAIAPEAISEVFELFPEMADPGPFARPVLRRFEAACLTKAA
jgi:hypothetical protein